MGGQPGLHERRKIGSLLREAQVKSRPRTPLFSFVSRLVDQKGVDLLIPAESEVVIENHLAGKKRAVEAAGLQIGNVETGRDQARGADANRQQTWRQERNRAHQSEWHPVRAVQSDAFVQDVAESKQSTVTGLQTHPSCLAEVRTS